MSYTKRQLILSAMGEIGLSSYSFDLSADQIEQALWRLDAMMEEWVTRGIRLGWPSASSPELSDAYAETNLPGYAQTAVITNLAVQIAPSYGKAVSPQTLATARGTYNSLLARFAVPAEKQLDSIPAGAGHKDVDEPFVTPPTEDLVAGPDAGLDFN